MDQAQQEIDFLRERVRDLEQLMRNRALTYIQETEVLKEEIRDLQCRLLEVDPKFRRDWVQEHPNWHNLPESL